VIILIFFSLVGNSPYSFGSVSDDEDEVVAEQPIQLSISNTSNSGVIATSIFDMHEISLGDSVQNLFILIPNEGHHGPGRG
jgi:hypothetical protein